MRLSKRCNRNWLAAVVVGHPWIWVAGYTYIHFCLFVHPIYLHVIMIVSKSSLYQYNVRKYYIWKYVARNIILKENIIFQIIGKTNWYVRHTSKGKLITFSVQWVKQCNAWGLFLYLFWQGYQIFKLCHLLQRDFQYVLQSIKTAVRTTMSETLTLAIMNQAKLNFVKKNVSCPVLDQTIALSWYNRKLH